MARRSYENRVYQAHLEDPCRPWRRGGQVLPSAALERGAILEEHAFAAELMAAEVPAVARWPSAARPCTSMPASASA